MSGTLAITFRGPFFFSIAKDRVDVYAPKCEGHLGGIAWSDSEHEIEGIAGGGHQHSYVVRGSGIISNAGAIEVLPAAANGRDGLLRLPAGTVPQIEHAHFHISVPRPKIIYGLYPNSVEVVAGAAPLGNVKDYATSLRFYYDWDVKTPVLLSVPFYPASAHAPAPIAITPPVHTLLPEYGDIEINLSGPASNDAHHLDAITCFGKIAELAGTKMWLNYYNATGGGAQLHPGLDCKAPPIVAGLN